MNDEVFVRQCVTVATATVACAHVCVDIREMLLSAELAGWRKSIGNTSAGCVAVQACAGRVKPSYSCIHVSRAALISFKGRARRNKHWLNGKWRMGAKMQTSRKLKSLSVRDLFSSVPIP